MSNDKVTTMCVDIGDEKDIQRNGNLLKASHKHVDIMINNAVCVFVLINLYKKAIVFGKRICDETTEEIQRLMNVNLLSHFYMTKTFLPDMLMVNKNEFTL